MAGRKRPHHITCFVLKPSFHPANQGCRCYEVRIRVCAGINELGGDKSFISKSLWCFSKSCVYQKETLFLGSIPKINIYVWMHS
jgi:hypothetical protein